MIKYSFVTGVYNTPLNYLELFFNSIFNSDVFDECEIIIFNDGSNSITTSYLYEKEKSCSKITILGDGKNHGLAYGLNRCIEIAKGTYIVRADSDDYFLPERVSLQEKYLQKNKYDIVGCNMYLFDKDGVWGEQMYKEVISKYDFIKTSPVAHPTVIMRADIFFDKKNFYSESKKCLRNEDYELFMRLFSNGYKIGNFQRNLYFFREDNDSAKRRTFYSRINEMKVKFHGFKLLKYPFYMFVYCLRPILIGLLPKSIYIRLKKKKSGVIK